MAPSHKVRISVDPESYRLKRGMSKLELSDKSGVARSTLRRKLKNPGLFTIDELATLSEILDMPAEAFEVAS